MTFQKYLCGVPARDYILQEAGCDEQIVQAAKAILTVSHRIREYEERWCA